MGQYLADDVVTVHPFTQQRHDDSVTIGNATNSSFLSVPVAAMDILAGLAEGKTVGQAQALYEQRHGESPDLEAFLAVLEAEGFVSASAGDERKRAESTAPPLKPRNGHFARISPEIARRICGVPVLVGCGALIGLGVMLVALEPSLLPPPSIMVFPRHLTLLTLAVTALVFGSVFLHELGHLVAARAAGVPAWLGVSHRLWLVVAETDMTGIWMAPKRQRYLAFLAGPLVDAVSASILMTTLWIDRQGWVSLPFTLALVTKACLFACLLRLLWQCLFFVRTDFYYLIAHAFDCKSLLADTEVFLRNQLGRVFPVIRHTDQSAIPASEMRVIRCYSLIWLAGRAVALWVLLFVTVPILWGYGAQVARTLSGAHSTRYEVIDALAFTVQQGAMLVTGITLWIRSLYLRLKGGLNAAGAH